MDTGLWSTAWRCCKAGTCWASTPMQMSVRMPPPMPLHSGQAKQPLDRRAKRLECLCRAWCPARLREPTAAVTTPPCQTVPKCADMRAAVIQAEHVGAHVFLHGNSELPLSKSTCRLHKLVASQPMRNNQHRSEGDSCQTLHSMNECDASAYWPHSLPRCSPPAEEALAARLKHLRPLHPHQRQLPRSHSLLAILTGLAIRMGPPAPPHASVAQGGWH